MTTEDFIKNVAHDLFSSRVTLTPIAEAKAIPCNIIPKLSAGYLQPSCHHCVLGGRRQDCCSLR